MTTPTRKPIEDRIIPPRLVTKDRGGAVLYYFADRLLAIAVPPRPWDLPDQWRAIGADGRTVEVNTLHEAMRRAQRYAEILIPIITASAVQ